MKKHTKIYLTALNYVLDDFIPSELSQARANDTHHIISRSKGGEDRIENLMALTRAEHLEYGDKVGYMVMLLTKHRNYLAVNGVPFDLQWFDDKIKKYSVS